MQSRSFFRKENSFMHTGWNQLYNQWMQYFHQLYLSQNAMPYFQMPISQSRQVQKKSVMIQAPNDLIEFHQTTDLRYLQNDYISLSLKIQQKNDQFPLKKIYQNDKPTQQRHQRRNSTNSTYSEQDKKEKQDKIKAKKILEKSTNQLEKNQEDQILTGHGPNSDLEKKLLKMLQYFGKNQKKYQLIINQSKNDLSLQGEIIRFMDQRIKSFGKSKEEMTKAIIRRVQKYHKEAIKQTRVRQFMNFGGLKSMNRKYLTQIFSNAQFRKSYMATINEIQTFFLSENKSKKKKLIRQISRIKSINDLRDLDAYLNGKSKMPWPQYIMERLVKVMNQLYNTYIAE